MRAVHEKTLKRMRDAVADLKFLQSTSGQSYRFIQIADEEAVKRKYYHILHDRVRATVTLAEVEMDLNYPRESETHLRIRDKILLKLDEYTTKNHLQGKVPTTNDLVQRIKNGNKRLQGMGIAKSRSSVQQPARSAQAG